jgi:hypothetical protein
MSSRQVLPQQAGRSRDSLVSALRAHGDHTELIAQRTRRFLQWKPNGSDRDAWLAEVLPAEWHATKAVAALNATFGHSNGNGTATTDAASEDGQRQQRTRRPQRRQRRT